MAAKPISFSLAASFIEFVRDRLPFFDTPEDKIAKYWPQNTRNEVLEKADKLLNEERYMEVYENLNKIKYSQDQEVIWRIAKTLYNLSQTPDITNEVRREMIVEAQDILESEGKSNYHKWMAIISNVKNGLESLETKVREYPTIRDHLVQACDSNPRDFTVQYMLGRWHYEMANLTWFQRKIAKYFFLEPPTSSFVDAYKHLNKAEELQPRTFLPNMYILGCVSPEDTHNFHFRAKYYLNMALNLPTHSECEKCCVSSAKRLLAKLEKYDLGKDLLYENYHFGFEE